MSTLKDSVIVRWRKSWLFSIINLQYLLSSNSAILMRQMSTSVWALAMIDISPPLMAWLTSHTTTIWNSDNIITISKNDVVKGKDNNNCITLYSVWKMGAWSVWGLHCDQLGLDRKLLPWLAILATQPWALHRMELSRQSSHTLRLQWEIRE